ncbi:probable pancreatic secretory proteinase inhibitor [Engraulis encrasicolus]|uniref:probable pancreatic secretory proteinase inhibitor n=1 Tax=Engraulis encrasicolus TaxID=184585 RepID=UPI002FD72A52
MCVSAARVVLSLCLALVLLWPAAAEGQLRFNRRPACSGMSVAQACPLNYSPVCGNDGHTYPNECALCMHRLEKNVDVLIVKEGRC